MLSRVFRDGCDARCIIPQPTPRRAASALAPRMRPGEHVPKPRSSGHAPILGRWTWDLADGPGRMKQTTAEALRANEAMLAEVHGRAAGRIGAWPLLLGFGACSPGLIRGAKALADRRGVGCGTMHLASHPSRQTPDNMPLSELAELGVLAPNAKLAHTGYVDDADIGP